MRAGVTRYVVRSDKEGNLRVIPANQIIPYKHGETLETMEKRAQRDLYRMECEQGARFNGIGEFSTKMLRKVWIENVERDNRFDKAREEAFARARGH